MKHKSLGKPIYYTDKELFNFALGVKDKLKGQKLTFKLLEINTGISRITWSRRLKLPLEP